VVLLALFLGLAICAPPRPVIPDVFYAKVNVGFKNGDDYFRGGGLYAYDVPHGESRTDWVLQGDTPEHQLHISFLDRYDLNETFTIGETDCVKHAATGSLPSPFAWVANANYTGNSTYLGTPLFDFQFVEGEVTRRVSVRQDDINHPVFLSERFVNKTSNNQTSIVEWDITFLEFDTNQPESWVFTIPQVCNPKAAVGGTPSDVVYFANSQWDCTDPSCSSRVAAGSGQPGYECAEFAARSLVYGGYIPGLTATGAQSSYGNWKGYNLLLVTGLADALASLGFKKLANSGSSVTAAVAVFGNGGDGTMSHACIGVGANTVDCHNNARLGISPVTSIMIGGIDEVYGP